MDDRRDEPATKEDLREVKRKLTAKIDANAAKIDAVNQRLTDVEQRLTAKIEANAAKIEENGRKIDANAAKIDANAAALARISSQVVENRDLIRQTLTRAEFKKYFDEIMATLDGLASGFAGLNQERAATNARLDRVEKDVEKNKNDIKKIKTKLAMP